MADSDKGAILTERSIDGKRGFRDGWQQGYEWAIAGIERGLTPTEVRAACAELVATMEATIERESQ